MIDYWIRDASIIDGSGAPAVHGDIVVSGERIGAVGRCSDVRARVTIEAGGRVATPGFIDMHSHSDALVAGGRPLPHKLLQGVTTELIGQDGISAAPMTEASRDPMAALIEPLAGPVAGGWRPWSVNEFLGVVAARRPQTNILTLTGHGNLRMAVMGHKMAAADAETLRRMGELLAEAMIQGSFGLSLGLIYPPCSYSDTEELVALGEVVRRHDGVIVSHIRDEQDGILDALDEMIAIGRRSGARIHISHLKCLGRNNWGRMPRVLERMDRASADGVEISFDQYPYDASCTSLSLLLPGWVVEGGWDRFRRRVEDDPTRRKVLAAVETAMEGRGGAGAIRIASARCAEAERFAGRTLAEAAEVWALPPAEAAFRIIHASRLGAVAIYHAMSIEDVQCAMCHPLHTAGSDGILGAFPHPRAYGSFARIIRHFQQERGLFSLETAIRDMTAKPAQILGLAGRGVIAPGCFADLVVFDPARFTDHATYDDPTATATGLDWAFVNGEPVVEDGRMKDRFPGRVLRPAET